MPLDTYIPTDWSAVDAAAAATRRRYPWLRESAEQAMMDAIRAKDEIGMTDPVAGLAASVSALHPVGMLFQGAIAPAMTGDWKRVGDFASDPINLIGGPGQASTAFARRGISPITARTTASERVLKGIEHAEDMLNALNRNSSAMYMDIRKAGYRLPARSPLLSYPTSKQAIMSLTPEQLVDIKKTLDCNPYGYVSGYPHIPVSIDDAGFYGEIKKSYESMSDASNKVLRTPANSATAEYLNRISALGREDVLRGFVDLNYPKAGSNPLVRNPYMTREAYQRYVMPELRKHEALTMKALGVADKYHVPTTPTPANTSIINKPLGRRGFLGSLGGALTAPKSLIGAKIKEPPKNSELLLKQMDLKTNAPGIQVTARDEQLVEYADDFGEITSFHVPPNTSTHNLVDLLKRRYNRDTLMYDESLDGPFAETFIGAKNAPDSIINGDVTPIVARYVTNGERLKLLSLYKNFSKSLEVFNDGLRSHYNTNPGAPLTPAVKNVQASFENAQRELDLYKNSLSDSVLDRAYQSVANTLAISSKKEHVVVDLEVPGSVTLRAHFTVNKTPSGTTFTRIHGSDIDGYLKNLDPIDYYLGSGKALDPPSVAQHVAKEATHGVQHLLNERLHASTMGTWLKAMDDLPTVNAKHNKALQEQIDKLKGLINTYQFHKSITAGRAELPGGRQMPLPLPK